MGLRCGDGCYSGDMHDMELTKCGKGICLLNCECDSCNEDYFSEKDVQTEDLQ